MHYIYIYISRQEGCREVVQNDSERVKHRKEKTTIYMNARRTQFRKF